MKKAGTILCIIIFIFIIFSLSCKKESSEKPMLETSPLVVAEIDIQKIESLINVQFKILKTETVGYEPLHKFYWVSLQEKINNQNVRELANAFIKETIARKPRTYHSFTIHFFLKDELTDCVEKSKCFAHANFLPEGGWVKVGRLPIDDYKSYKLTLSFP